MNLVVGTIFFVIFVFLLPLAIMGLGLLFMKSFEFWDRILGDLFPEK